MIEQFSNELISDFKTVNKMELEPQSIVSDFSFAILNGLSLAFHGTSLKV